MVMTDPRTEPARVEVAPAARKRLGPWVPLAAIAMGPILAALGLAAVTYANPCQAEDDDSQFACHWNAQERGNHLGTDFVNIGYGRVIIHLG